jgi:RNA polymerase sigma-54 factor
VKAGLVQQQVTKMALTKELRQAITLLQYTSFELTNYLNDLSLENPFIKLHDPVYKSGTKSYKEHDFEIASPTKVDLDQYLVSQVELQPIHQSLKKRVLFLIGTMDEDGYIRDELCDLSLQSGYLEKELQEAQEYIQEHLDPIGIGAQNLQQSLLLQIKKKYPTHIVAHKIVEQYFIQLAERKWEYISKELHVPIEGIQRAFELIKTLNPRPGGDFKKIETTYIVPDLFIEKRNGTYHVLINERSHTSFSIDEEYISFQNGLTDKESLNYLKEKYQEAKWVRSSIEQRKRTMVLVTQAILIRQQMFFEHGISNLQPLTLKEIAKDVELHESTISRTVRGKYVQTPSGVYELKYFFHSSIKSAYDQNISSVRVKEIISHMISNEDKRQKPLSDQKISSRLMEEHKLTVSRRTVAKYRDQLRIPPSSSRKQL